MAKRSTPGPGPSRRFTPDEKRTALARLESRIDELVKLDFSNIRRSDDPPVQSQSQLISSTLASIYGQESPEYERLSIAADLDMTVYAMHWDGRETPPHEVQAGVRRGIDRALAVLGGEVKSLREDLSFAAAPASVPVVAALPAALSDEIFIVHGRDDAAKTEVTLLIERAGLKAIVLHEQPNGGRTIIQKFEDHGGAAGFAIVLMSPDDVGGLDQDSLQPRARQNVIGEMFWFAGRLGRERVCALKKGNVEVPTDFAGVGYVDMDKSGAWKKELLKELEHAGYKNLNWQKALA